MTKRFDENNIIDYINNFNKKHIRNTKHSKLRLSNLSEFSFEDIIKIIKEDESLNIEKQVQKNFTLIDYL